MPTQPPVGTDWTCARCARAPAHLDDLEAFAAGYTSSRRDIHGGDPFTICAACMRIEAHDSYRLNVEYWTRLGSAHADVEAMLMRPS